jgi:CRP/FNR family transcriptional regulator
MTTQQAERPAPAQSLAPGAQLPTEVACANCNLRELCMPAGLSGAEMDRVEAMVGPRRKVLRGRELFHGGAPFHALYAVRSGFFKTCVTTPGGREQVTGFQMAGEIMGMDGIMDAKHSCSAIALEDAEVCVMPYDRMQELAREVSALQTQVHRIMSREIVREHGVMLLLGSMRAEERVAAFLLNLSQRMQARGFSRTEFILRMTRADIGSHLGLKLETVSRTFSKLQDDGVVEVSWRRLRIVDMAALELLAGRQG